MREPKVGEIWQNTFFHQKDDVVFEYIKRISDDCVWVAPVGTTSGQNTMCILRSEFVRNFFYVQ